MATPLIGGKFYDPRAVGLSPGAALYTYAAGTLTPLATYTDAGGGSQNTNPVILNAYGQADVFLGNSAYRFRLYTDTIGNGGTLLWDEDNISSLSNVLARLADPTSTANGDALVAVAKHGAGATSRTQDQINEERIVSITDFGGVSDLVTDNTAAFNACLAYLGANGGVVEFPVGNWRGNYVVNQHNVLVRGRGGIGELDQTCLRPYTTAGGTTLKFSNATRVNRKCGIQDLVVSGDNGTGTQADNALWIAGGTVNFWARNFDLMGGTVTLRIEPGSTYPATALKFSQGTIRNDVNTADARAIYIRKYADAVGYVTDLQFHQFKVNKTGAGYWLEVDGTGSTGLVVHFGQSYVDHTAGLGIRTSASGLETIECDGGLQLDPGAAGTVIMSRQDLVKDPSRYLRGHIEGVGGQKIQFSDASTVTFPVEPGHISYMPLMRNAFNIGPTYWTNAVDPYNTTTVPYQDLAGATGPLLTYGGLGEGQQTVNGARWTTGSLTEEITLSTSGTTTNSVANLLPDNSIIESVVARVTQTITTATNWQVGDPTTAARFIPATAALTAGTTAIGLTHCDQTGAAGPKQTTGNNIRITTTGTPGAGKIRVTVFFRQFIAPTS